MNMLLLKSLTRCSLVDGQRVGSYVVSVNRSRADHASYLWSLVSDDRLDHERIFRYMVGVAEVRRWLTPLFVMRGFGFRPMVS
jgi:hypothetical protein